MSIYDINGNPIGSSDSYFEVVNGVFGPELRPKAEYRPGYYRSLTNTPDFWRYFGESALTGLPDIAVPQTRGKYVYICGDSLHAWAAGNGSNTEGFATDWNRHLGANVTNAGYAGSTWTGTTGGGGIQRVTELVAAGKPYDAFILAWGTNIDAGGDGTIDDAPSNAEGCTMVAAMKWCIDQLRAAFPRSAVGIIIPPPVYTNDGMKERGDLMIEVCQLLHVPYVDMRERLTVEDLQADGVHLGAGGAAKYGAAEAELIMRICPYGDPL